MHKALFLGLTTYDIIYEVESFPASNEKIVALEQVASAGGPATNAAITFSLLGGNSTLLSAVGKHHFAQLLRGELKEHNIHSIDLTPDESTIPFSSVIIEKGTGKRSVISVNAVKTPVKKLPPNTFENALDILLVDGHQMKISLELCAEAQKRSIPTVLDGGSWKTGTEHLLPYIDHAICSADFAPPNYKSTRETIALLHENGIKNIAITRGKKPILLSINGKQEKIHPPAISNIRSTLGAGDIFHGAFCYFILDFNGDFSKSLKESARIASLSCQFLKPRQWASRA